jgi:site-specific recombinase XerD
MLIEGPLTPWVSGMAEHLEALGYAPLTIHWQMRLVMKLSRFLERGGLQASEVSPDVIAKFIGTLCVSRPPTSGALAWLLAYLRGIGVAPAPVPAPPQCWLDEVFEQYRPYLAFERGLAPETVDLYERAARLFLSEHAGRELKELGVDDVSKFMTRHCRLLSPKSVERLATGLRSFLGFALLEGWIAAPLAGAVPSAARWRGAALPRGLTPEQVAALLDSCDRRRSTGRRDYAILILLTRLGLRAIEVAALRLDDINWRAGTLVVRGKGRTEETLPLPSDVGAAITAYLRRGRPRRPEREVFLRAIAPLRGLSRDGIGEVVRAASERAGLGSFGSHRLRHTAGTGMLRAGASLSEVAQVLRHRSIDTTAIYAKVDYVALRGVAMPWPGASR